VIKQARLPATGRAGFEIAGQLRTHALAIGGVGDAAPVTLAGAVRLAVTVAVGFFHYCLSSAFVKGTTIVVESRTSFYSFGFPQMIASIIIRFRTFGFPKCLSSTNSLGLRLLFEFLLCQPCCG
jgi:hypothetical protein